MRRLFVPLSFCFLVLVSVIFLAACSDDQTDPPAAAPPRAERPILNIYGPMGSKATLDTLHAIVESTDIPFDLRVFEGTLVAPGVQGVLDGTFDLMLLGRRPQPDEPLAFIEFVYTPVAFFVNPSAGMHDLTQEQAAAIYSGEVTNWSELGGADQDIVLLFQEADNTNTDAIRTVIMQGRPFTEPARSLPSDQDVLTLVDGIPGSIGYAAWAGKKHIEFILSKQFPDAITLDGVHPDDPTYSLYSVVGVAFRADRESFLQPLFDWGERFVSLGIVKLLLKQFGLRLAPNVPVLTP